MTLSNQYPRLPWELNPEPVHGGFIAWPHGPDGGRARVYYHRVQVDTDTWGRHTSSYWWVWTVGWTERFAEHGMVSAKSSAEAKQAAADKATTAYWDAVMATEGWTKPMPAPEPAVDLVAWHFWRRFEDWLWNRATLDEVKAHLSRYLDATRGLAIMDQQRDRCMARELGDAYAKRLNFGFDSARPAGQRGHFARLRAGLTPQ